MEKILMPVFKAAGNTEIAKRIVYFPITSRVAAEKVANHLVRSPNDSIIIPFIDQNRTIIDEILTRRFRSLTICEPDDLRRTQLNNHIAKTVGNKKIHVYPDDLFDLSFKTYSDNAQNRCARIVKESITLRAKETRNFTLSPLENRFDNVKFLVPLLKRQYESAFMRNLYYQTCCRLGLCSQSLVHYYFLLSDRQHNYLLARPSENMRLYRSTTVLYNTIFNVRTLESFDLKSCFGISVKKLQNTAAANNRSYESVHLVWLEPNLRILTKLNSRSLLEFRFLVTQMMHKRTGLVHNFLSKFFCNFKEDLTSIGIDTDTRCGDLSKEQYYSLFMYLNDCHDYKNSTFMRAVENYDETILSV